MDQVTGLRAQTSEFEREEEEGLSSWLFSVTLKDFLHCNVFGNSVPQLLHLTLDLKWQISEIKLLKDYERP